MDKFWNKRRIIFAVSIVLSAFIVFFVARSFNKETLSRSLTLTNQGILNFRKGLDVSGGTKLTYRINYDKYNETYKDATELATVKSTVEDIILKNIDGRISKLGVSDYKSYIQKLDNETQIVVEIGGVADLDQAKEIIGKTVELEFKLPNKNQNDPTTLAERRNIALALHDDIEINADKMQEIADGRRSENIYYTRYDQVGLAELPSIYQANSEILKTIPLEQVSEVFEGAYGLGQYEDAEGYLQNEEIEGFTFFRILERESGERTSINAQAIVEVATDLGLSYNSTLDIQSSDLGVAINNYKVEEGKLFFNNGEIYANQEAYKVRIFVVTEPNDLGLNAEELAEEQTNFDAEIEEIKNTLAENPEAEITQAQELTNSYLTNLEIRQAIPEFNASTGEDFQIYSQEGITYLVKILEKKTTSDKRFWFLIVEGVNQEVFETALASKEYYTIEEVFVQDRLTWATAQSSDGKILNGATFKYASVSQSQLGQPVVVLNFDDTGKAIFCDITTNSIGSQMAIFIWGEMVTAPVIQSKICDGTAQIDGQFTPEGAKELTSALNDGALPAPLILMQEEKVSATLGENALSGAIIAGGIGFVLIFIYMCVVYGIRKGIISLISLWTFTLVLLALVKLFDYALSLSGIAAIILNIWLAVDANILIFERMREEKAEGKGNKTAINVAYERSWNAIRDAQLSTGLIGLLLFMMGINMFKGFGSMLVVGVVLTLLVNVPLIKELLYLFFPERETEKTPKAK